MLTRDIEGGPERSGGSPGLRAKPARSEHAVGSGADGRQPGRGTAPAAGRTGPPPGRTAHSRSRRTAAGPGIRSESPRVSWRVFYL